MDESSVMSDHGDRYPYIESPEGKRLWLADLDPRQSALAERLVEVANLGNNLQKLTGAKARPSCKTAVRSKSKGRQRKVVAP